MVANLQRPIGVKNEDATTFHPNSYLRASKLLTGGTFCPSPLGLYRESPMTCCRFLTFVFAILSLLPIPVLGQSAAIAQNSPAPLGKLVDVGGYRVHVYCTGTGDPRCHNRRGWIFIQLRTRSTRSRKIYSGLFV